MSEQQTVNSDGLLAALARRFGIIDPLTPKDAKDVIEGIAANRKLDAIGKVSRKEVLDYLWVKTCGKKIDDRYYAYCATILNEFFIENQIYSFSDRRELMQEIIPEHIQQRVNGDVTYKYNDVKRINEYNHEMMGYVWKWHPLVPWIRTKVQFENPSLNGLNLSPRQSSFNWNLIPYTVIATLGVVLTAKLLTFLLFSRNRNGTTTQSLQKLRQQLTTTDIIQSSLPNMIRNISETATDTLRNSLKESNLIQKEIIASVCQLPVRESSILQSLLSLRPEKRLEVVSNLLLK